MAGEAAVEGACAPDVARGPKCRRILARRPRAAVLAPCGAAAAERSGVWGGEGAEEGRREAARLAPGFGAAAAAVAAGPGGAALAAGGREGLLRTARRPTSRAADFDGRAGGEAARPPGRPLRSPRATRPGSSLRADGLARVGCPPKAAGRARPCSSLCFPAVALGFGPPGLGRVQGGFEASSLPLVAPPPLLERGRRRFARRRLEILDLRCAGVAKAPPRLGDSGCQPPPAGDPGLARPLAPPGLKGQDVHGGGSCHDRGAFEKL
mmetsp:Transcript_46312/g.131598  ORF Transcript_46312/g.131598 Transcript_46312/m.131598 type:complete len:266 (-) Transcript_46312:581-1378(-)